MNIYFRDSSNNKYFAHKKFAIDDMNFGANFAAC
jgi:hypothetical protein